MTKIKGNRGEWSEFYGFLKILLERKLWSADEELNKVAHTFCDVIGIPRREGDSELFFDIESDKTKILIKDVKDTLKSVPTSEIKKQIPHILKKIIEGGKEGSFAIPKAEKLLHELLCKSIKPMSRSKSDIILRLHNKNDGRPVEKNFSIKSRLGGAPTLLNASQATNFIYRVSFDGVNPPLQIFKEKIHLKEIFEMGGKLHFLKTESLVFEKNLRKIDSSMHKIVAAMLIGFYAGKGKTTNELCELVRKENPDEISLQNEDDYYEIKIKNLLLHSALGMLPATPWDGKVEASGGYLVVKENGELVCFHVYDFDLLKQYLYISTKLETPSTKRQGFGKIYEEGDNYFIKLNLQIRFIN